MFDNDLKNKLNRLFDFDKVTYDEPSDSNEFECLFISVSNPGVKIKDGYATAKVEGECFYFGNSDKIKFGYFSEKIDKADSIETKDLFFYDIENNERLFNNKVQRSFKFVYFFRTQYDPELGTITSIDTNVEVIP
jgi:hypothetical protein